MKRILVVGTLLTAALVGLWPALGASGKRGSFNVDCVYSHSLPDDPIVAPGVPGGSHMHDFFGNESTNAGSTYESMRAGATKCRLAEDTGGYWNPTAYIGGVQAAPTRVAAYYFGQARRNVRAYPPGLQLIGGNPRALSRAENPAVTWACGHAGATPVSDHPYDCSPYGGGGRVTARVAFPSCWDGTGTGPASVVYPSGKQCPAGFEEQLPKLSYRVRWRIVDPCMGLEPCTATDAADENIHLSLSSGPYYTMHADFWNTWNQARIESLIASCVNAHRACGEQET